ncbi:hypothetical protein BG023_112271 [Porphyrobacter sp. LM 6]|nr:hypothetical protein BG023_112271 [Porphyrobacter sp. LM 6]
MLPVLGGLAYLQTFGAPSRLIVINALALVFALAWTLWGRVPSQRGGRLALAGLMAFGLFLPLLLQLDAGGVSRWIPLGPVLMHSGTLLLPLLIVLTAREPRLGPAILGLALLALGLQPDAGTLLGLTAATAALAVTQRSTLFALVSGAALVLTLATFGAGTLEPQAFTEGVLAQVWAAAPLLALGLGAALLVAPAWLLYRNLHVPRAEGYALAALLAGLGVAAILAPFPFPLIGYGASPILGFGLALGALGRLSPARESR